MKTSIVKFYKPELDGLRFFAFFLVFFEHLWTPGGSHKLPVLTAFIFSLRSNGWIGVDLFLCLSSYLITKLLFLEWKSKATVSIKGFYIRRVLRIWPLYFLACLLGFLIFPMVGWFDILFGSADYQLLIHDFLWPYLSLVGNWAIVFCGSPSSFFVSVLWTISLEEQFYLVGPVLLRRLRFEKRTILKLAGFILILTAAARFGAVMMGTKDPTIWVCTLTRLDPFVLGTCLAIFEDELIRFEKKVPAVFFGFIGLTLLITAFTFADVREQNISVVWQYFLVDLGLCCLIFSVIQTDILKRFFSFWIFVQLGKISYGLYIYHVVGYYLANMFLARFLYWVRDHLNFTFTFIEFELMDFLTALAITIVIALISYYCFERVFLKLKSRFTAVESRPV